MLILHLKNAKVNTEVETVPDNKLDTLMAELRVIEVWDEAVGWNPEGELERVGLEARRIHCEKSPA